MSVVVRTLKPLCLAFTHMFRRVFTIKYPFQAPVIEDDYRGRIQFFPERCISCGICESVCPTAAIKLVEVKELEGFSEVKKFKKPQLDFGRCCFCNFCVDYCPSEALKSTWLVELAEYEKSKLTYTPYKLSKQPERPKLLPKPKLVKLEISKVRGAGHAPLKKERGKK